MDLEGGGTIRGLDIGPSRGGSLTGAPGAVTEDVSRCPRRTELDGLDTGRRSSL